MTDDDTVKKENGATEDGGPENAPEDAAGLEGSTEAAADEPSVDPAFRVDVPDDLLEEAVETMERRIAEAKGGPADDIESESDEEGTDIPFEETMEFNADGGAVPEVAIDVETTSPEDGPDLESMSVDDILASGLIPDKLVTAFNEERQAVREARAAEREAREKLAATLAEGENFRKRLTREKNETLKYANEGVLKEILPVFDNLERALQYRGDTAATVIDGVQITLRQFLHVLQKVGLERVQSAPGTPFDPHVHEAVAQVQTAEVPPNTIAEVLQGGFTYHERLLRPAMVSVAKQPAVAAKTDAADSDDARNGKAAQDSGEAADDGAATDGGEAQAARLERIRRVGAAAREARRKAREEREAAQAAPEGQGDGEGEEIWPDEPAADGAAARAETEDERVQRLRRVGAAARDARRKKREARSAESTGAPEAAPAPAPTPAKAPGRNVPSFESDDLDDWESSMEAVRTDKSSGSGGSR